MKKFNISVPKKYTKNGEEKTAWNNVGKLVYFPATAEKKGGFVMELNMFPDVKFGVFEDVPKEVPKPVVDDIMGETVSPDDIPF